MNYHKFARENAKLQNLGIKLQHMGLSSELLEQIRDQLDKSCNVCGRELSEEEQELYGDYCWQCYLESWEDDDKHPRRPR